MTTANSARSRSNFGAIRSSASSFSSAFTPARSRKGDNVYNPRTNKRERISRLIQIQADKREDIETCYSGDIAAIVGIKNITTGDTLCDEDFPILLEPPSFPDPVISMAIEPKTKQDQEKMGVALQRLSEEDPTFKVFTHEDTGQTIIAGMGELHLEIIRDRMLREFKVDANAGKPQIAYRETITAPADGEGKLIKQSGGRGQYGHVIIKVQPNERGKGITIENKVVGGNIPKEYIPACKKGIEEAMLNGVIGGYQVIDANVDIVDGSYHDVDSNEMAFKLAAIFAVKDAFKKAKPILLEPIMKVENATPEEYQGDIMGDLNRRRGKIGSIEVKGNLTMVQAEVPLAEMFGYATAIRSLSKGRSSYSMEPSHFEQVPQQLVAAVLDQKETNNMAERTTHSHSPEGIRSSHARSIRDRHRRDGEAHRRARGGTDSAPDLDREIHGQSLPARRQKVDGPI